MSSFLVGDLLDDGFALRRKRKKGYKDDNFALYEVDAACRRTKSADH